MCTCYSTSTTQTHTMTAGSIIVPTIIPLRAPAPGRPKQFIDSNTRIEIKSGKTK